MKILGFNKLTLLDYPSKTAVIIFLGGCNFLCPFCHNSRLVSHTDSLEEIDEKEVLEYLKKRRNVLEGVCITGGEPLLQNDLIPFLQKLRALDYCIKIDTNGSLPERLQEIIDKGLVDYIAMDIKSSFSNYSLAIGIKNFDISSIKKSIEIIRNSGIEYEFRTTLVNGIHLDEDLESIGQLLKNERNYYIQTFSDSGDLIDKDSNFSKYDMARAYDILIKNVKNVKIRE